MKKQGTVCFIVEDKRVLLAEISYPNGQKLWNGIGGVVDDGEKPMQAVIREVSEETEISVVEDELSEVKVIDIGKYELHIFVATKWSGRLKTTDPTLNKLSWFEIDSMPYEKMHKGNDEWLPLVLKKYSD